MTYSIIIPIFNERDSIASVHAGVVTVMQKLNTSFEIIIVDDGSNDGTSEIVSQLHPATIISLRKNFGQTAALDVGIKHAIGDILIMLDGDGQNPPSEIPKLLAELKRGKFDLVAGWRKHRKDPWHKRIISRFAYLLRGVFVKDRVHDSGCTLKVARRECFDNVDLFGEMHRFIPAILGWSGFTISEVVVEHRPRTNGKSKYDWRRMVKGFIDMISVWFWRKYANRPLHLFGGFGLLIGLIGGFVWILLGYRRLILHISIAQSNLPLIGVLLIIVGFQFFISGLLADIAIRNYYGAHRRPYSIRSVTQNN